MAEPTPAAPPAPPTVEAYDPSGQLVTIPVAQLSDAKAQGYNVAEREASDKSVYEGARSRGYTPLVATGLAATAPFLSFQQGQVEGATAGLGLSLQKKIAGVVGPVLSKFVGGVELSQKEAEDYYAELGKSHSWLHTGGEVGGMVGSAMAGPVLAGTKAATLGRGLSLISEAGEGAATAARGLTAGLAARGALGRAAATGAELAARGALETGIYSGVHEMSEEMLGKPEVSAEKIFAAAADGAGEGALFGGVLGAGGSLAGSAARGTKSLALDVLSKNADGLQKLANSQRWRALDPLKKFTKEAERRVPGGTDAVAETLGRYGVMGETIQDAARGGDVASISTKIDEAVDRVGKQLGDLTGSSTAQIPFGRIEDAFEKTIAPLRNKALHEGIVRSLEEAKQSIASHLVPETEELITRAGQPMTERELGALTKQTANVRKVPVSIQDALEQRKAIDQIAFKESRALDPKLRVEFLRDMRRNFEEVIVSSFDDAAKAAGTPGKTAELLQLKKDYQALSLAQEAAADSTSRMQTNRNVSLSDMMAGGFASHIGTAVGGLAGPLGAGAGGLVGGAIGSAINRYGRSKGNSIAAAALDRLAAYGGKARTRVASLADAASEAAPKLAPKAEEAAVVAGRAGNEAIAKMAVEEPHLPAPPLKAHGPLPEDVGMPVMPTSRPRPTMPDVGHAPIRPESGPMPELAAHAPFKDAEASGSFKERLTDAIHHVNKEGRHSGMPPMYKIRQEFPELSKAQFDANMAVISRDNSFKLSTINDIKHASDAERNGMVSFGDIKSSGQALGKHNVNYGYLTAFDAPSGKPWQRASSKESHEAARLAAEDAHIEAMDRWNAHDEALDEAHGSAMAEWKAKKAASEHAFGADLAAWENQQSTNAATHAAMLEKVSAFARAQRALKSVDEAVEKAAAGLVRGVETKTPSSAKMLATPYRGGEVVTAKPAAELKPLRERFDHAKKQVEKLQENQPALAARALVPISHMPNVSGALGMTAMRAAAYLTAQVPAPAVTPVLGAPTPTNVSTPAMSAFLEKYEVVKNPVAALRAFSRGAMTQNQADALRVVSPEIFAQLQRAAVNVVASKQAAGDPLPFAARQRMHLLLGVLTDPSQDPKMMRSLQENLADMAGGAGAPDQNAQAGGGARRGKPLDMKTQMSGLDRNEAR